MRVGIDKLSGQHHTAPGACTEVRLFFLLAVFLQVDSSHKAFTRQTGSTTPLIPKKDLPTGHASSSEPCSSTVPGLGDKYTIVAGYLPPHICCLPFIREPKADIADVNSAVTPSGGRNTCGSTSEDAVNLGSDRLAANCEGRRAVTRRPQYP